MVGCSRMDKKRIFDTIVAATMLFASFPIFLVTMAILRLTGEREVFYRQKRVGLEERRFTLYKFATMLKNSPNIGTGTVTVANDPRVLPVGRVLRWTKINELPQLWNVLRGDMSLIGPRPLAEPDFSCYNSAVRHQITRVRPGLSGVGSIVFRNEEEMLSRSTREPTEAYRLELAPYKGALECWYVENRSFALDLRLLALTAFVVLLPNGRWHERWLRRVPAPPRDLPQSRASR